VLDSYHRRMGRVADLYARISPKVAHKPGSTAASRLHAIIYRKSQGRVGGRLLGADVLTLRTIGRRSGQQRDAPMFFLRYGNGFAVVASNAGSVRPPAWWLNLQVHPEAEALIRGTSYKLKGRAASSQEEEALWPRFVEMYAGYDHYRSIAMRAMPVVILEPC